MNEQRTEGWAAERAGKFTASAFADVLAASKRDGKKLKAYDDLIWRLVAERMSGEPVEGPHGFALKWGEDVEPYAREAYEAATGYFVDQSGFIVHPDFPNVGCSPDGLIGDNRGLEMKCPKSPIVHLERFLDGVPDEYIPQIQGCMWVTGREVWDFVSYDPRMCKSHRLLIVEVPRDQAFIDKLQAEIMAAEVAVLNRIDQLTRKAA